MARTSLTVKELRDLTDTAARTLANLAEAYTQRNAQIAVSLFEQANALRDVATFADRIIDASGQGCAADAVILELGDDSEVR